MIFHHKNLKEKRQPPIRYSQRRPWTPKKYRGRFFDIVVPTFKQYISHKYKNKLQKYNQSDTEKKNDTHIISLLN